MHDWSDPHGFWMILYWAVGIGVLLLVVWGIARSIGNSRGGADSPEQILKRRYARGEIDRETYQERLRELRS
ncbi:MAG: SHOCT domain-containing protein [Myxococcota bacterium]